MFQRKHWKSQGSQRKTESLLSYLFPMLVNLSFGDPHWPSWHLLHLHSFKFIYQFQALPNSPRLPARPWLRPSSIPDGVKQPQRERGSTRRVVLCFNFFGGRMVDKKMVNGRWAVCVCVTVRVTAKRSHLCLAALCSDLSWVHKVGLCVRGPERPRRNKRIPHQQRLITLLMRYRIVSMWPCRAA